MKTMDYEEMKKYYKGKSEDGLDNFEVSLKVDEDGLIGRECPNEDCQIKYFKISNNIPDKINNKDFKFSNTEIKCPYCGILKSIQKFHTKQQIEWIKSMLAKDFMSEMQRTIQESFSGFPKCSTNDIFSISMEYKPANLPPVKSIIEEKLKTIILCDMCGYKYAVYGLSFHCPLCGEGNLLQHLNRNINIIKIMLDETIRIGKERGIEIANKMIENALEDVVGLFEGFLKLIYKYVLKKKLNINEANEKIDLIKTDFQRIEKAKLLYKNELSCNLFESISIQEEGFLQEQFLKRHVLTHNLGLVDEKYREKINVYVKMGAELEIKVEDVLSALELVNKIIIKANVLIEE